MTTKVALTFDDVRGVPSVVIATRVHLGDIPDVERGCVVEHCSGLCSRAKSSKPGTPCADSAGRLLSPAHSGCRRWARKSGEVFLPARSPPSSSKVLTIEDGHGF